MKRRIVRIIFFACVCFAALTYAKKQSLIEKSMLSPQSQNLQSFFTNPKQAINQIVSTIKTPVVPLPTPTSEQDISQLINQVRQQQNLTNLPEGIKTCALARNYLNHQTLSEDKISALCPECQSVQLSMFSQPLNLEWFASQITSDASMSAYFLSDKLTHLCVATSSAEVAISLVSARSLTKTISTTPIKNFTEAELWNALSIYRQSQGRTTLSQDDKLCEYARKRVNDQLELLASHLDPASYPNPDKYPLDAHDGFSKDAESGLLFDMTQRQQVAENLAYWPTAQDPIHVIEWGWDTSTEGHRETQLSNDFTHACLSGKDGFYVAIFAK